MARGLPNCLGGVIKCVATSAVCAEKLIIRNSRELYDFLVERCILNNDVSMLKEKHCVMNREFFYIERDEIELFRDGLGKLPFKTYAGTQKLHQVTCHNSIKSHQLMFRKYACLCIPCVIWGKSVKIMLLSVLLVKEKQSI